MLELFSGLENTDTEEVTQVWDFGVDFDTGQLSGEIVYGKEALAVWCFFALQIARYRFRAFSWEYGSETEELIGQNYGRDYTEAEIKRMVNECVCCHPNITGTENFSVSFEGSKMHISFKIITDFGDGDILIDLTGE